MIIAAQQKKKKKETSNDNNGTWTKSTAVTKAIKKTWEDGYQFGDISKTILGVKSVAKETAKDVATNIGKGFMNTIEGTVDAARYGIGSLAEKSAKGQATIWELFGNDEYAKELKKAGQDIKEFEKKNAQYDVTANLLGEQNDIFKTNWSEKINQNSILGTKSQSVAQGFGNVGAFVGMSGISPMLGGGEIGAFGQFANSFSSAYGNTRNEAYKNGANDKDANRAGWISGLAEGISEQFFSGIPGMKTAGWGDTLNSRLSESVAKFFGSNAGKVALTFFDGVGEGTEEILSNMFNAIGTDVMHYLDENYTYGMENMSGNALKDIKNSAFSQDSLDSFVSAMLTSVLTGGGKQLTQNVIQSNASNRVASQGDISKQQATELINQIAEKRANLNLDEDANFKEKSEAVENQKQILAKEIKQAAKEGQKIDLNELLAQTPNSKQEVQFSLDQDEFKNVKSDKQKVLANDMARLNNVKENHDLFKTVNAIQGANNTQQYHITTTEGLYEMGIVNKDANGNYTMPDGSPYVPRGLNYKDGDIYINADVGSQSGTQAVYHEMFEGFKKASPEQYNEFKQMVTDIIGEENIQKEFDTYKAMYGEELTDDIRDEIINDKFGELAESQDFINRISDNRTLLQKFIDTVKNMINYVKGTEEERKLIKLQKELEKQFAKRYKETDFSQGEGGTAYSLQNDYDNIKNQREELRQNLLELRKQRGEIIENIPNYSMFNKYDELTNIDNQIDKNINQSKELYKKQQELENQLEEQKQQEKQRKIDEINKNSTPFKEKQFKVLQKSNPMLDDYHTGIRQPGEIMTWQEAIKDAENSQEGYSWGDFTKEDAERALKNKSITVYSSYPIKNGVFVSTSRVQAEQYAGGEGNYVYSKTIRPDSVAWINVDEGQYANVGINTDTKYSLTSNKDSQGRELSPQQQEYFKDTKIVDNKGNLLEVYRGEPTIGKTTYESRKGGGNKEINEYGIYFTNSKDFAKDFAFERISDPDDIFFVKKGKEGEVKSAYLNITNPLDLGTITEEEIRNLYPYESSMAKQLYDEDKFVSDMLHFQEIGNHQLMKSYLDMKAIADNTDYDGLIAKLNVQGDELEYAVFNSNQIKSTDNLNPTSDSDIRLSLTSNENIDSKEIAPVGSTVEETIAPIREDLSNLSNQLNNLSNQIQTLQNGLETTPSEEIAPVNPYRERAVAQREANQAIDEIQKDDNYWQSLEKIANEEGMSALDDKSARKLSRNIGKELGLKQKQVKDLQNVINDAFNNGYSLDQIKEELYSRFGHDSVIMRNEEAIDAQKQIREYRVKVSPEIQKNITDYGYWKQQYFGKIKFSKDGDSVDSVYGQLSEQNPAMFPSDIWNETDQLLRIAEVADMDKKYSMDYEMDQATIDEAANYIHDTFNETLYANAIKSANDLEQSALQYNDRTKDIPIKKRTRQEVRDFLQSGMGITTEDLQAGNDIKSMQYQLTTPERVNEKVFGREVGRKINEQTVNFAKHQEAERTRFLNKERNEIKDLGIKARSKESALVQQYGEGLLDDVQLAQQVENVETQNKIKNAARVLRGKYDAYLDQINEVLTDMGYDPIPKRKDYMRHFQELTDKFSQAGIPFNRQDLNAENLPTDINGLTEFNTPGKNYFASAKQRKGFKTTYDAITGIDGYLEGASNLMYHTETIQRYRTLEKMIRDTYGQTHGLDEFNGDVSSEEAMQRVQDIENGKLSNYAAWIHEQGNAIAGKKGALDRGFERALGRRAYTLANTLKKQTGSNMTGFNVRSALTNFISSTIAAAKTNKMAMVHGTIDTIKNIFHDDGFINRSDFLTSRFGSDSLSQKTWQKISNAGQIFMQGSDWFTSNLITRSKYYEGLSKGMTDTQAMNYANDFAARVMGDRSKGATAEAFNSKTLGFLTQFQLETNNQWQYMIHDTKMEFQENLAKNGGLKASSTVLFQMGQLAAYSYLFNEMFEKLTGSRAAFDIADILKKLFGLDPDDEDKTFEERMKEAGSELVDALPFASLFGSGGRLPIGEMLTPFQTVYDYITGGTNKYGDEIKLKDVTKDLKETLPYYLLPTGYGQLKKTIQGLGMYNDENPIPGSYTDSGNLRFTADTDTGSIIKNALFGQWSGEEAKKYRESGYKTINAKDIPVMKDLGMSSSEFREFKTEMKEETTTTMDHEGVTYNLYFDKNGNRYWYDKSSRTVYDDKLNPTDLNVLSLEKANANELKYEYVSNLNIDEDTKQKLFDELFSNTTTDKYGYKKYTDESNKTYWYDEDNDTLYNSKYSKVSKDSVKGLKEVTESKNMDNYKDYGSYAEFDYAYKNPGKYKTIKAIAGYDNYKKFDAELKTIRDNTKQDKKETIKYVNSLDLTIPQKAMFIKQYYPTFNDYNKEIVNYVSNLDVSYEDKVEILKSLKFKVDSNGNVKW